MIKCYIKSYLFLIICILSLTLFATIINYFLLTNISFVKTIISIISLFASSIYLGRRVKEKAYLDGIKYSSGYIIVSFLLTLIFRVKLKLSIILIYLIYLLVGIIGATIGINFKSKLTK